MLDALKVLFILTGTSTYLVTKYVKVGIEPSVDNSTTAVSAAASTITTTTTTTITRAHSNNETTASIIPVDKIDRSSSSSSGGSDGGNNSGSKKMLAIFERNHNNTTTATTATTDENTGSHYQNRTALGFEESSIGNRRNDYAKDRKSSTMFTHDITHNRIASDGDSRRLDSGLKTAKSQDNNNGGAQEGGGEEDEIIVREKDERFVRKKINDSRIKQLERNLNGTRIASMQKTGVQLSSSSSSSSSSTSTGTRYDASSEEFKNWIQSKDGTNPIETTDYKHENDKLVHTINIVEEDPNIPKLLIKVGINSSSSGGANNVGDVTYFLNATNYDQIDFSRKFRLNSSSGELYLVTPLDRDLPFGRPNWRFSIMARHISTRDPFAYADVVIDVIDVNDNTPFFEQSLFHAAIKENSPSGLSIIQITATDYDSAVNGNNKVRYLIDRNHLTDDGNVIFGIDSQTGVITSLVCCLDRETAPQFMLQITAVDSGGLKGSTTVIINILDANDCAPKFRQRVYTYELSDEKMAKVNTTLMQVFVDDSDLPDTNRLSYRIEDKSNRYPNLLAIVNTRTNSDSGVNNAAIVLNQNISALSPSNVIINFTLTVIDVFASSQTLRTTASHQNLTAKHSDTAVLTLIVNLNSSVCPNAIAMCSNGGYCEKRADEHTTGIITSGSVSGGNDINKRYYCKCAKGFSGDYCDDSDVIVGASDGINSLLSDGNNLYYRLVHWITVDDNSYIVVILFGLINVLVIILIAIIYRRISRKLATRSPPTTETTTTEATPAANNTECNNNPLSSHQIIINNTLVASDDNANRRHHHHHQHHHRSCNASPLQQNYSNELTVISVPSYGHTNTTTTNTTTVSSIAEEDEQESSMIGDHQCPDVVDCARVAASRPRHVFITSGYNNNKWQKSGANNSANFSSLDDIRLYGNSNAVSSDYHAPPQHKVWSTNVASSASMEMMDCGSGVGVDVEANVIYV